MKPNDKAIDAALSVTQIPEENMREYMRRVLTAAYAAQFYSNEYVDIIRALRVMHGTILAETVEQFRDDVKETMPSKAADAIETLLAKLNGKPKPSEDYAGLIERLRHGPIVSKDKQTEAADALEAVLAERDAMKDLYAATDWVDSKLQTFWPADMDDLDEVDITLTYREIRALIDARSKARGE